MLEKKQAEKLQKLTNLIQENEKGLDQLLKTIIDSSNKLLLIVSEGKVLYSNHITLKTIGYTNTELKSKLIDELFTSNQPVQLKNYISMAVSLRKKHKEPLVLKLKCKNGIEKWYKPEFYRCFWEGKVSILISLHDINSKSNVEASSIDDVNRIALALKASNSGIWDYNIKADELYISPEFFNMLGYEPNVVENSHESWLNHLHPDSLEAYKKLEKEIVSGEKSSIWWDYQIKNAEGNYIWLLAIGQVIEWDNNAKPMRILSFHLNIDEKKRYAVERDRYQDTLRGFIKNSLDGFAIIDEKGVVKEWNPEIERITRISSEQILGKYLWNVTPNDINDESPFISTLSTIFSNISRSHSNPYEGKVQEISIATPEGKELLLQLIIFTINTDSRKKIAITMKDITETKLAQKRTEKSEERLKLSLSAGHLGIWDIDFMSNEVYISPMAFTLLGFMPFEVEPTNSNWKNRIHPDDFEQANNCINKLLFSGGSYEMEIRVQKKDGSYIWILSKIRVIKDEHGKTIRASGTISDISRQKNNENELRQKKDELLKNIAQHELISDVSIILNTSKPFFDKNNEVLKLLGHFTNVSRVYIFENSPDQSYTVNTYEWCNQDIEPQIENLQEVPLNIILSWAAGKDYMTSINLRQDLPEEFADMMIEQGIQSFLIFPLYVGGKLHGYIGFDECKHQRKWEKPEIELLKSISNIISFAYERELAQKHYRQNELRYRELTEKLPQIVFEVSVDGTLLFLNQVGCSFFGVDKEMISTGIPIRNFFPENEVEKLETIRDSATLSEELEGIKLSVIDVNNQERNINVYARPRIENSEIVSYSGLALIM
ncbi:MAG TPA: PAS domain S-box protein [Tenuifilaceae bacterium]|nr:PAS domain S-box protein [Tenuifilaceae bacterium]HPE17491.1 PAS domain S-box protein [Tenuifilaceae bacterium]HPJ45139.1 PAS domain S-box protein [Tenuifilaceae bacterium]HPQ33738.1 PAS domain S-box protein [Tenuifilaceae bacterium]HRX67037.1 PAS domain S-box protein [Tenuifilaceae bacterium]